MCVIHVWHIMYVSVCNMYVCGIHNVLCNVCDVCIMDTVGIMPMMCV